MEDKKRENDKIFLNENKPVEIKKNSLKFMGKSLGENIRKERELRGLTLEELAELTGLSSSYLGLLERGERHPSFKVFSFLLDFFGLEPNDLMLSVETETQENHLKETANDSRRSKCKTLEALLRGLNDAELDYLIEHLKLFRKFRTHIPLDVED